jgi:hypothetical protein
MKAYEEVYVYLRFPDLGTIWMCPEEKASGTHWIGRYVGPRDGFDAVEKRKILTLLRLKFGPVASPARSQSLYRLSCSKHLSVLLVQGTM